MSVLNAGILPRDPARYHRGLDTWVAGAQNTPSVVRENCFESKTVERPALVTAPVETLKTPPLGACETNSMDSEFAPRPPNVLYILKMARKFASFNIEPSTLNSSTSIPFPPRDFL